MRNSQRLQIERDEAERDENILTLSDFFQLCQESQMISKLLNAILQLCTRHQVGVLDRGICLIDLYS